jgi:hypothetical protein
MWVVEELGSGAFVGRVGLHYPQGWPEREVGWALARPYWGRGYAFEAATAALRVAFDTLGWSRAASLIAPLNLRSIRLAERLGERFERHLLLRGHEEASMRSSARMGVRPDARVQLQRRLVRRSDQRPAQPCGALLTHHPPQRPHLSAPQKVYALQAVTDVAIKELQPLSASSILTLRRETIAVKKP